jgi:hypothetical protein
MKADRDAELHFIVQQIANRRPIGWPSPGSRMFHTKSNTEQRQVLCCGQIQKKILQRNEDSVVRSNANEKNTEGSRTEQHIQAERGWNVNNRNTEAAHGLKRVKTRGFIKHNEQPQLATRLYHRKTVRRTRPCRLFEQAKTFQRRPTRHRA